jgi:hypothetical protein
MPRSSAPADRPAPARCTVRRLTGRLLASVLLVGAVLAGAGCGGTTEARENRDLEPGSGDLGGGDAPPALDSGDEPDDTVSEPSAGDPTDADVDGGAPVTTVPLPSGPPCGDAEARAAMESAVATFFSMRATHDERLAVVQHGGDPAVADALARARTRAALRDITGASVTDAECLDDGSVVVEVSVRAGTAPEARPGSLMLVDGSWRITLHAFCEWTAGACGTDGGLLDRAVESLSAALRRDLHSVMGR